MKQIDATNILKTMNWMMSVDENNQTSLEPILNKQGMYECDINLSLIEKTVIGIGASKIESIDNATTKAAQLIDEFLEKNPSFIIQDFFRTNKCVLEESDKGFLSIEITH